jgi:hypothetical protein
MCIFFSLSVQDIGGSTPVVQHFAHGVIAIGCVVRAAVYKDKDADGVLR